MIDPRTLVPSTSRRSSSRSSAPADSSIAHEAVEHGGFGAEIAAQVQRGGLRLPRRADRARRRAVRADPAQPAARGRLPAGRGRDRRGRAGDVDLRCQRRSIRLPDTRRRRGVRLRDRRRRIGGLRARGAPERGPRRQGRAARGRRAGQPSRRSRCRSPSRCCSSRASTGISTASRSRGSAAGGCTCRAARCVGGSGSINAMIYLRGNRADYDGWAAGGAEGWSYDEVLPYFKRSEDNERGEDDVPRRRRAAERVRQPLDEPADRDDARGRASSRASTTTPTSTARARTAWGASRARSATGGATRPRPPSCTRPRRGRTSRSITDAMALRILFDGTRAVGVEVARGRQGRGDPGRARGDPLGRLLPVAGAADALGHRAGGGSRALRDDGAREPAGRPRPAGSLHVPAQLRDRRAVDVRDLHARELRAASSARAAGR